MKKDYLKLFLLVFFLPYLLIGQEKTISGTVKDAGTGESLPGVTIQIKGASTGTITDFDGNYSLQAKPEDVLVFSFIGYQQISVPVGNQTTINIDLQEDVSELEEVVVVGYGTQKKTDLTGAVAVVEVSSIKSASASTGNPMQALQGRVPGLYIEKSGTPTGGSSRILVRGVNTLGNNDPLYIIDGVPTKRAEVFQSLNPSTIKTIQVLKDASAASIYGSRASNGVIIVTTHNGSQQKEKLQIQTNVNFSVQTEKPQRFEMLNAQQRGVALWQASVNDGVDPASGYGEIYDFDWNGDFNNPVLNSVTVQPFVGGDPNVPAGDTDWQDATYETGYVTNTDLTISGGDEDASLLLNLGYLKNTGMLKYTNYDRISARLNAYTKAFDGKFTFGANSLIVSSNETLETPDLGSAPTPGLAVTLAPTIPIYTLDGDFAGPLGAGYSDRNNPIHMQYINRWDNTARKYLFGNVYTEIEPIENLKFRSSLGLDYSMIDDKDIEQSFEEGFIARDVNSLTIYESTFRSVTFSNTLQYELGLGSSTFNFLIGVESVQDDFEDVTSYKEGFSSQTEDFFVLSAGTRNGNAFQTGRGSRLLSQFAKVDFSNSEKYLASFTLRRDGSSRFGEENRYGIFPAATVGWKISDEAFMNDVAFLSKLKLRAGIGRVGNQDVGDFASLGLFSTMYGARAADVDGVGHVGFFDQYWNVGTAYDLNGANTGNLPSGFVSIQAANPALKWETTDELNVGVDFALFNGSLLGSFDYFTRVTSDILISPPVASAVGEGQRQFLNGATQENNGWEVSLGYYADEQGPFTYSVFANLSHFEDKITELPENVRTAYPGNAVNTIIGQSALSIFGYETDGLFQSQEEVDAHANQPGAAPGRIRYKDLNNDGQIDGLDQKFLGTTLPALEYSLRVDMEYNRFSLSVFGSGVAGRTGFDPYIFFNEFIRGRENVGPGVLDAWTPTNTSSTMPALTLSDGNNETRTSDYFNVNTSYFKIRNIQLGYDMPSSTLYESLRLYVMAENVVWFSDQEFKGPDPERISIDTIPVPTTLSIGLNATF